MLLGAKVPKEVEDALELGKVDDLSARALKEPELGKALGAALDSSSSIARGWAAHVLGNVAREAPENVVPHAPRLAKLAVDSDDWLAAWALYALAELAAVRPQAVVVHADGIGKRLGDPILMVASRAAQAIGRIGAAYPDVGRKYLPRLRQLAEIEEHVGHVDSGKWDIRSHKSIAEEAINKIEGASVLARKKG